MQGQETGEAVEKMFEENEPMRASNLLGRQLAELKMKQGGGAHKAQRTAMDQVPSRRRAAVPRAANNTSCDGPGWHSAVAGFRLAGVTRWGRCGAALTAAVLP